MSRNFQLGTLSYPSFIFNTYKNRSGKINVHALPDLRVAAGSSRDGVSVLIFSFLLCRRWRNATVTNRRLFSQNFLIVFCYRSGNLCSNMRTAAFSS